MAEQMAQMAFRTSRFWAGRRHRDNLIGFWCCLLLRECKLLLTGQAVFFTVTAKDHTRVKHTRVKQVKGHTRGNKKKPEIVSRQTVLRPAGSGSGQG